MIKADVHMHTNFSHDSDSTPEQMAEGAIKKGLEVICFTDHYDKDDMDWGPEDIFDPDAYFEKMVQIREKYKDQIQIRIGVELGLQPHLGGFYEEFVKKYPFDFVIGSIHSAEGKDIARKRIFEGRTDEETYRIIFREMVEDVKVFNDFDVFGHVDYVARYGRNREKEYSYQRFADEIDEVLKILVENGCGIELNMAGLKYGLPFAHPHTDILKRYRELGGELITVGADGHRPDHIAYDYHKVRDILESCGFKYYAEFKERKPSFFKV
jgi:histidinol-phosphatase (PHP family)